MSQFEQSLNKLIGKTIVYVKGEKIIPSNGGTDARVCYHLKFSDGTELSLMADGGCSDQYTHIETYTPQEVIEYKQMMCPDDEN